MYSFFTTQANPPCFSSKEKMRKLKLQWLFPPDLENSMYEKKIETWIHLLSLAWHPTTKKGMKKNLFKSFFLHFVLEKVFIALGWWPFPLHKSPKNTSSYGITIDNHHVVALLVLLSILGVVMLYIVSAFFCFLSLVL